ncbi:MAG: hypothetical protein FE78DRAFT_77251 [Acidomyces sp. 'richmondensis']|nr:MAG: hypothetical protein FE78DRAFT_77251 [Acidomyces sp. 'richmondensis']
MEIWKDSTDDSRIWSAHDLAMDREMVIAKENHPVQFDPAAMRAKHFGFLIVVHDTTSMTIHWVIKLLNKDREVQEKFHATLRAAFQRAHRDGD